MDYPLIKSLNVEVQLKQCGLLHSLNASSGNLSVSFEFVHISTVILSRELLLPVCGSPLNASVHLALTY